MDERIPTSGIAELPHLATFARAAERASFTAVACELGVTQAAVSQRIAALERELRVSLFDRRAGRIALTDAGQRLYGYARRILNLHDEARADIGGISAPVSGDLAIAASSIPGECFLASVLFGFHAEHPSVHVRATVSDSGSVLAEVEKGRASLGLVGLRAESAGLESRPIGSDSLVLIVPSGHRWAARRVISLDALGREPIILRERGSGSRRALETSLERVGIAITGLTVSLELGSNAGIKDAVKRGLGVAFVSRFCVQRELAAKELCSVSVRGLDLTREFYLVYHRRRPLSPAGSAFRHFLESHPIGHRVPVRP
jgi:DNA-binding transcriptional LysR family regulator